MKSPHQLLGWFVFMQLNRLPSHSGLRKEVRDPQRINLPALSEGTFKRKEKTSSVPIKTSNSLASKTQLSAPHPSPCVLKHSWESLWSPKPQTLYSDKSAGAERMLLGYSSARYKGEPFSLGSSATLASTLLIGLSRMCKVHPRLLPACLLGTASSSCRYCVLSSLWVPTGCPIAFCFV